MCCRTNGYNIYSINYVIHDSSIPINVKDYPENNFKIVAYDFTGNPLLKTKEANIDLSNLKSGIYILKANIDGNILTKKVIR